MARPRSDVPTYRKHRSGQARVTINGRDYYLGPHGTKASKARIRPPRRRVSRQRSQWLVRSDRRSTDDGDGHARLPASRQDVLRHGPSSEWHRIKLAFKPIKELYAATPAVEFGPEQFKAVRQRMIDYGLSRTGSTPT